MSQFSRDRARSFAVIFFSGIMAGLVLIWAVNALKAPSQEPQAYAASATAELPPIDGRVSAKYVVLWPVKSYMTGATGQDWIRGKHSRHSATTYGCPILLMREGDRITGMFVPPTNDRTWREQVEGSTVELPCNAWWDEVEAPSADLQTAYMGDATGARKLKIGDTYYLGAWFLSK